jgi:hypothetical protein
MGVFLREIARWGLNPITRVILEVGGRLLPKIPTLD